MSFAVESVGLLVEEFGDEFADLFGEISSEVLVSDELSELLLLSERPSSGRLCEACANSGITMSGSHFRASA